MSIFVDTNPRALKDLLQKKNISPSRYMSDARNTPGFPFEKVLNSHRLPVGECSPFFSMIMRVSLHGVRALCGGKCGVSRG